MALPRGLRLPRSLDRLVAVHSLVFSYRHPDFIVRELAGRTDCLLYSRDRAPLTSGDAITDVAGHSFQ